MANPYTTKPNQDHHLNAMAVLRAESRSSMSALPGSVGTKTRPQTEVPFEGSSQTRRLERVAYERKKNMGASHKIMGGKLLGKFSFILS